MPKKPAKAPHFPEQLVVKGRGSESESFSAAQLQALYDQAIQIAKKSKQASCYVWMKELKIPYSVAVFLMDQMENVGAVKPMKEGEFGPRKL